MNTSSGMILRLFAIVVLAISVSACEAIGTIFQAGMWVGVIMVMLVVGIAAFLASKLRRRS